MDRLLIKREFCIGVETHSEGRKEVRGGVSGPTTRVRDKTRGKSTV